jgi:hypothetical protein
MLNGESFIWVPEIDSDIVNIEGFTANFGSNENSYL